MTVRSASLSQPCSQLHIAHLPGALAHIIAAPGGWMFSPVRGGSELQVLVVLASRKTALCIWGAIKSSTALVASSSTALEGITQVKAKHRASVIFYQLSAQQTHGI